MNERSFETLLYGITANVIAKIMELNGWSENQAMERFLQSKVYAYRIEKIDKFIEVRKSA